MQNIQQLTKVHFWRGHVSLSPSQNEANSQQKSGKTMTFLLLCSIYGPCGNIGLYSQNNV